MHIQFKCNTSVIAVKIKKWLVGCIVFFYSLYFTELSVTFTVVMEQGLNTI